MLDLSAAFDTLDHSVLIQRLRSIIGLSKTALLWFESYLSDRSQSILIDNVLSEPSCLNVGVPQGSVLGPVLFNIYTSPLYHLCQNSNVSPGFYADDSQLYIVCKLDSIQSSMGSLEKCISDIEDWMLSNRLKLNGDKTELTIFNKPSVSRKCLQMPSLCVSDACIEPQSCCRNLGSFFDKHLSMDSHIQNVCKASYYHLKKIASIRPLLDIKTTASLVHAFISSKIDFCNSLLFGITKSNINKLQKLQNHAARLCLKVSRRSRTPSLTLLKILHWLPILYRIDFKILLLVYKSLNGLGPSYLSNLLNLQPDSRQRRSMHVMLLDVPKSKTKTYGDRAFSVAAARLWNALPVSIRTSGSVTSFKTSLKTHMFRLAFD